MPPTSQPMGLGPTDLNVIFTPVFQEIVTVRQIRGLPAITIHIGQEYENAAEDAPRLVVIPDRMVLAPARGMGNQTGQIGDFNPKPLFRCLMHFAGHCWGDEGVAGTEQDLVVSFNTAIEIMRELLIALAHNCGGPAATVSRDMSAEWSQPTNMQRRGRLLIVKFSIEIPITQEPYITLAYATSTTPGVSISTTQSMVFPDGSSSVAGIIVTPPP